MIPNAKAARLRALANPDGIITAIAMDQRKSLRKMIAMAASKPVDSISDAQLAEFKAAVTETLSPHASAILLDPEYGAEAFFHRSPECGLLMTYERDGFENPRPHRMLELMPEYSVRRLRDLGAKGVKVLLSWSPEDDQRANDAKCALVERIGGECRGLEMPFFLEPLAYDPEGVDSLQFAKRKPGIVIRTMEEFSKEHYHVDVLKVEFPAHPRHIGEAYTRADAIEYFRSADAAARRPYIYLSAGVDIAQFTASLELANEAGARYSGVLCGRAIWQGGIGAYVRGGIPGLEAWLEDDGVRNVAAVKDALKPAVPWERYALA